MKACTYQYVYGFKKNFKCFALANYQQKESKIDWIFKNNMEERKDTYNCIVPIVKACLDLKLLTHANCSVHSDSSLTNSYRPNLVTIITYNLALSRTIVNNHEQSPFCFETKFRFLSQPTLCTYCSSTELSTRYWLTSRKVRTYERSIH